MEDLPQEFLVKNSSVNVEFIENKTGKITAGAYLKSVSEIVNGVQQIGDGALLIINNYFLRLICGNDSIYLFDSHSKGTSAIMEFWSAVLLNFYKLYSLENYIRSVYYNIFH